MVVHDVVTTGQPADQTASEQSALRDVLPTVFVIVVYLLIGIRCVLAPLPGNLATSLR
jgi:hypothetical protein